MCSPAHPGPHWTCPCLLFPFMSLGTPYLISTGPLLRSRPDSRFRNPLPRRCSEALPRSPLPSGAHNGSPLPSSNVLPRDGTSAAPHFSPLSISPKAPPPAVGAYTTWGHLNFPPAGSEPGGTTPRTGRRRSRVLWELPLAARGLSGLPGFSASRLLWFSRPLSDPPFFFSPSSVVFSTFEGDYSSSFRGGEHFVVVQSVSPDTETLATIRGGRNG